MQCFKIDLFRENLAVVAKALRHCGAFFCQKLASFKVPSGYHCAAFEGGALTCPEMSPDGKVTLSISSFKSLSEGPLP